MYEFLNLPTTWYVIVGVLFAGYAILDGFDLGTGILHLFIKKDTDRRLLLNAVGPVWDGNEVWLITGGGALFAAFPDVYATVFSGFYIPFMLLLLALILRAVSIEFRSKQEMPLWRKSWDIAFATGSFLSTLLIGVAMGNIARGIPLNPEGDFMGSFWSLLNPYALLLGLTTVALFAMHGGIFLVLKTEGELQRKLRRMVRIWMLIFLVLITLHAAATVVYVPHAVAALKNDPWILLLVALGAFATVMIPQCLKRHREGWAFIASCTVMGSLMALLGASMFPNLVYSLPDTANSLTAYNACSSQKTLEVMTTIALCGMPVVLSYSAAIYWIFRGKVKLNDMSY